MSFESKQARNLTRVEIPGKHQNITECSGQILPICAQAQPQMHLSEYLGTGLPKRAYSTEIVTSLEFSHKR